MVIRDLTEPIETKGSYQKDCNYQAVTNHLLFTVLSPLPSPFHDKLWISRLFNFLRIPLAYTLRVCSKIITPFNAFDIQEER